MLHFEDIYRERERERGGSLHKGQRQYKAHTTSVGYQELKIRMLINLKESFLFVW